MFGYVLRVLEKLVKGDGARVLGEGRCWRFKELVAELGESGDGGLELRFEGFGFGTQGQDAAVIGLVVGN